MSHVKRAVGLPICFALVAVFGSVPDTMASGALTQETGSFGGTAISSTEIRWSTEGVFGGERYELHTPDHTIIDSFIPADPENPPAEITFNETGLEPGTEYCRHVLVEIRTSPGVEVESEEVCVTTLSGSVPPTPTNFRGTAISTSEILWEWDDVTGETSYEGHNLSGNVAFSVPANTTSFTEGGFGPGTTVTRHLHSRNANGLSQQTTTVTVTTELADAPECIVRVSPECANEPGGTVTFVFLMLNTSDETKHYVVTQDMAGAFLFSIPKASALVLVVQINVSIDTYRLHPKAWCKIFDEAELKPAQELQKNAQKEVKKVQAQLKGHSKKRMLIDMKEMMLITAVESREEKQVDNIDKQLDNLERVDQTAHLNNIESAQESISTSYGKPPEADAEIIELNMVAFRPAQLMPPLTLGPDDEFVDPPPVPEFERGPERIPDDKEDDPGFTAPVNRDDDDEDEVRDLDDIDVSIPTGEVPLPVEDDIFQQWWFFARPVDGEHTLMIDKLSTKIKLWQAPFKGFQPPLPIEISQPFDRSRVFVEGTEESEVNLGETVKGSYDECQDTVKGTIWGIEIRDRDRNLLVTPRVAKLEDAFDLNKTPVEVLPDFIDGDPERFVIQVGDKNRKNRVNVVAEFVTVDKGRFQERKIDPSTRDFVEIELKEEPPGPGKAGPFFSKTMILVSDDKDDNFTKVVSGEQITGSATDDERNDRTHKVIMGDRFAFRRGIIKASYKDSFGIRHTVSVKVCDKEVKDAFVHFIVMRPQARSRDTVLGSEAQARKQVEDDIKTMQERYLQCCVRVRVEGIDFADPPGRMDLTTGTEEALGSPVDASDDELAIFNEVSDLAGVPVSERDHIDVIYIDHFVDNIGGKSSTAGDSFYPSLGVTARTRQLFNVSFIAQKVTVDGNERPLFDQGTPRDQRLGWIVVPHEVAHQLTNTGHVPDRNVINLLHAAALKANAFDAPKRLFNKNPFLQCDNMRKERPFLR